MTVLVLSIVLTIVYGAFVTAMRTEKLSGDDSEALAELRVAADRFTRELREARRVYVTGTDARRIRFWSDENRDNQQNAEERITWEVRDDGTGTGKARLVRFTDEDPAAATPIATQFKLADTFTYHPVLNPTVVTLTLMVDNQAGAPGLRTVRTDIRLRNAAKAAG